MSIASAILQAQQRVANAYTAISAKGGTLPATQNLANMPTAIGSISTGGTIDSLTITPTTSQQTITASGGVDGYSPITVNAVTHTIDSNISAGNIVSGVTILGVQGSATELNATTASVTPTTSAQTITPTSSYNAFDEISVSAVTSSIDNNITAGNIKSGVSILGVSGSLTPLNGTTLSVTPTTSAQSLSPSSPYNGYTSVSVSAVTSSIDANITEGNIKDGVSILGVTGTYTGGGGSSQKYNFIILEDSTITDIPLISLLSRGVKLRTDSAYIAMYGDFGSGNSIGISQESVSSNLSISNTNNTQIKEIHMQALKTISSGTLFRSVFSGCTELTTADFSGLETIISGQIFQQCFLNCTSLVNVDFSNLTSFVSLNNPQKMFSGCTSLTTVKFEKMTDIYLSGSATVGPFSGSGLTNLYFYAVTTSSTFSITRMLTGVSNCTVHFPSNLQTTISGTTGYPTYNGTNTTLAFDLPATS